MGTRLLDGFGDGEDQLSSNGRPMICTPMGIHHSNDRPARTHRKTVRLSH